MSCRCGKDRATRYVRYFQGIIAREVLQELSPPHQGSEGRSTSCMDLPLILRQNHGLESWIHNSSCFWWFLQDWIRGGPICGSYYPIYGSYFMIHGFGKDRVQIFGGFRVYPPWITSTSERRWTILRGLFFLFSFLKFRTILRGTTPLEYSQGVP